MKFTESYVLRALAILVENDSFFAKNHFPCPLLEHLYVLKRFRQRFAIFTRRLRPYRSVRGYNRPHSRAPSSARSENLSTQCYTVSIRLQECSSVRYTRCQSRTCVSNIFSWELRVKFQVYSLFLVSRNNV